MHEIIKTEETSVDSVDILLLHIASMNQFELVWTSLNQISWDHNGSLDNSQDSANLFSNLVQTRFF